MTWTVWLVMWIVFAIPCWKSEFNREKDNGNLWWASFITAPIESGLYTLLTMGVCYLMGV